MFSWWRTGRSTSYQFLIIALQGTLSSVSYINTDIKSYFAKCFPFILKCFPPIFCLLPLFSSTMSLSRQRDNSVLSCVQVVCHKNKLWRVSPVNFDPDCKCIPWSSCMIFEVPVLLSSVSSIQITYNSVIFPDFPTRDLRVPDWDF